MTLQFAPENNAAIPVTLIASASLDDCLSDLPSAQGAWARATGFSGGYGKTCILPGPEGTIARVLIGIGDEVARKKHRFGPGAAIAGLPSGIYALDGTVYQTDAEEIGLGYLLSCYRFDRYKDNPPAKAMFVAPKGLNARRLEIIAEGEALTRDLINTPTSDMGPAELEAAARDLAERHGADISVVTGEALLEQNFPLVHAVGRASASAPRLIEMLWGNAGPSVTLVGKGVCFDTGGLNLKPGASMGLMKKDMGGSAAVLGLAHMIMALGLKMRLRILIPAVENSVSGNAFRPGDILTARNGATVEINNTDAEGRLVLADALALGAEGNPDLMVSMATLTGAARVAVGPDLAPFYTDDEGVAASLTSAAAMTADPVWRLPFHDPYDDMIEPGIADLDNAPKGGFAGSITAALFLRRFAPVNRYLHFDMYGWQPTSKPARPKGGVGQGTRALLEALEKGMLA